MAPLYEPLPCNASGHLKVSELHSIYYEDCGKIDGLPVVFLHGGPGGGFESKTDSRYYDPAVYRFIGFDQRGAGKSKPVAEIKENTTQLLVGDIERLREHLGIDKWVVFGGSWGSTLALAYSTSFPERCLGLILRGIFTLRREELLFFYQKGTSFIFPDYFAEYEAVIPKDERDDMIAAYHKRLTDDENIEERNKCALAWSKFETATSKLIVDPAYIAKTDDPIWCLQFARIECHYFQNRGFFSKDDELLSKVDKIKNLPIHIIQGRYDMVCPAKTSWDLYQALGGENARKVTYTIVAAAGHSAHESSIQEKLVDAANEFRALA